MASKQSSHDVFLYIWSCNAPRNESENYYHYILVLWPKEIQKQKQATQVGIMRVEIETHFLNLKTAQIM
jgi:hypothetical protein